jgi:hypothetical protein
MSDSVYSVELLKVTLLPENGQPVAKSLKFQTVICIKGEQMKYISKNDLLDLELLKIIGKASVMSMVLQTNTPKFDANVEFPFPLCMKTLMIVGGLSIFVKRIV